MLDSKVKQVLPGAIKIKPFVRYILKPDKYFLWGLILAIITALLNKFVWIIFPLPLLWLFKDKWGDKALIFTALILFMTFITDLFHSLRLYIQVIGFLLLAYVFFKTYGFKLKEYPRLPESVITFLTLFYVSMIASTIFSSYLITGIEQVLKQTIFFLIVYYVYAFLDKGEIIRIVLYALGIATLIYAVSSLYEYGIHNFDIINYVKGTQIRITGILGNINASGSYFGAFLPISLASVLIIKSSSKKRILYAINFILFTGLIFTTSRSAYLSFLVSILFIFYMLNRRRLLIFLITLFFLTIIILVVPPLYDFFALFFRVESGLSQRSHLWKLSIDMIKDNPFFGIGPGAYSFEMLNYFPVLINSWVGQELIQLRDMTIGANNSHNFFLFFTSDMGILGFISSLLFPFIFIKVGFKALSIYKSLEPRVYIFVVALLGAGLGLFFRGFFEGIGLLTYGWITMDLPFWIIFSVLIALRMKYFGEKKLFGPLIL